jgi:hypothetical protein
MKELEAIVEELKTALVAKGKEIKAAGPCAIKPVTDAFLIRLKEVVAFERSASTIQDESTITMFMIAKFQNDAQELLRMISRLVI